MDEKYLIETIGTEGIERISSEFYTIMKEDDLVGKMYPDHDWEGAEKRFRDFLLFRLAGDQTYLKERGHPRLRARHAPFLIGEKERDRWMEIMDQAMRNAQVPDDIFQVLHDFFAGVADFMRQY